MGVTLILVGLVSLISTTTITAAQNVQEVDLPQEALDCMKDSLPVAMSYKRCDALQEPAASECLNSVEQNPENVRILAECDRVYDTLDRDQKDYMDAFKDNAMNP